MCVYIIVFGDHADHGAYKIKHVTDSLEKALILAEDARKGFGFDSGVWEIEKVVSKPFKYRWLHSDWFVAIAKYLP
jgi:hypothetical protein